MTIDKISYYYNNFGAKVLGTNNTKSGNNINIVIIKMKTAINTAVVLKDLSILIPAILDDISKHSP